MAVLFTSCGRGRPLRGQRWRGQLALLILAGILWQVSPGFTQPTQQRIPRIYRQAVPGDEKKASSRSLVFLAVKDAIYAALFGAPYDSPESTSGPFDTVTDALSNFTSSAASGAASGVKAVESASSSVVSWGLSKLQDLGSLLHLHGGADTADVAQEMEAPEAVVQDFEIDGDLPPTPTPSASVPVSAPLPQAESGLISLFNDGSGLGAEPGDFFLFIKDYSWSLRYRVSRQEDSVDTERPLLLDWIKLRRPVQKPADLLEIPSSDLFDWDVVEPPRHSGFMYQVTEVVGSGVEAVINFFKDRGPKLLVQQDGVSLVNEEAETPGKPVTHCWVQCFGLPFLPVLQYIAFLNHDEIVTDWRA